MIRLVNRVYFGQKQFYQSLLVFTKVTNDLSIFHGKENIFVSFLAVLCAHLCSVRNIAATAWPKFKTNKIGYI